MDSDAHHLTFAPVTRDQARLFAGIARMLDRRGVACRFASPSDEATRDIEDEWTSLVEAPDDAGQNGKRLDPPQTLGPYDACRYAWTPPQR